MGNLCHLLATDLKHWHAIKHPQITEIEKKTLILSLPCLGNISSHTITKLGTSFKGVLNRCKLQIFPKVKGKLQIISNSKIVGNLST